MVFEAVVFEKIALGVTLSAPIGPVSLEMIKRGLNSGFWQAFIVRLGGAVGNTLCLVAAYFGLGLIMKSPTLTTTCSLLGSLVLVYLGLKSFMGPSKKLLPHEAAGNYGLANGLITGFVLALLNPVSIVFWVGIYAATVDHTQGAPTWLGLLGNLSIILGVLLWGFFLSCLLEMGKRFFNEKFITLITRLAGLLLIGFGLKYGYKAINILFLS